MNAFHQRIEFCLKVHNEAVKAMRYPPKKYNEDLETAQVRLIYLVSFENVFFSSFRNDENVNKKN
jgi:26S proteasome regulatory subunit N3